MPTPKSPLESWIARRLRADPPRSKSLIMTVFGDALLPAAESIRLSELSALLLPFGVNAQLARTSCFRLAEEGWLQSAREGRHSRYAFTLTGRHRVGQAQHRIYDPPANQWDGTWTLVLPGPAAGTGRAREALRRELAWAGFGRLGPALFLHPRPDLDSLGDILTRLDLTRDITVFAAQQIPGPHLAALQAPSLPGTSQSVLKKPRLASRLASTPPGTPPSFFPQQCWDLTAVARDYRKFLAAFAGVLPLLQPDPSPAAAFALQTLLIHAFRRVVLHDPRLPAALLPKDWPGHAAYDLSRAIYRKTAAPAARHWRAQVAATGASRPAAAPRWLSGSTTR